MLIVHEDGTYSHNPPFSMSEAATKQDIAKLDNRITKLGDRLETTITANTQEIISHFNASQGIQNERMDHMDKRFDRIDSKLDTMSEDVSKIKLAVVDLLATDRHMHNLVRELGKNGMTLDESKIFVA